MAGEPKQTSTFIQPSFAAGELSPLLFGRVDLDKYKVGLALARNWFVDYRGGISNRPGTEYGGTVPCAWTGQPRIIPFIVNVATAYLVVLGNEIARFIFDDSWIYEAPTTISGVTNASPGVVTDAAHGYSNGDEIFIDDVAGMTQLNGREFLVANETTDTYTLQDLAGNDIDTTAFGAYVSGGTSERVYEISTPWVSADVPNLNYTQSADVLTVVNPGYFPQQITRTGSTTFSIDPVSIGPSIDPPTALDGADAGGVNFDVQYGYVVTAVSQDGKEESLVSNRIDPGTDNPLTTTQNKSPNINLTWTAPAQIASQYKIYRTAFYWSRDALSPNKASVPNSFFGLIGQSTSTNFTDTVNSNSPDFSQNPPQFNDPFSPGQIAQVNILTGGSYTGPGTTTVDLTFSGGGGSGAAGYAIIDQLTNAAVGVVITNFGKNYATAPTVTAGSGGATFSVILGSQSGTYPSSTTYFQQRASYGGTPNFPESFTCSQPGKYGNFDLSPVATASDSISASIASVQNNTIQSMVPMSTGMIVFTAGSAFLVTGGSQGSAVTESSIVALPQASFGASALPPIPVNYNVLYSEARGSTVRDLTFNFYYQNYVGIDRSVLSSHLFTGYTLEEWAFAQADFRLIHTVRNDGTLLTFTYVPEQEVFAWTHYDTQGQFVSVASIPEGNYNAVYVIVYRYVPGAEGPLNTTGWFYHIERFDQRLFDCLCSGAWFLDDALTLAQSEPDYTLYPNSATGTVTLTVVAP